jgi:RNA polymerase sigma factor (sigma-70 family)
MISIAIALKKPIDYLFPETLLESVRKNTFQNRTRLLDDEQVKQITGPPLLLLTDGGIEETEETTEKDMLAEELKKAFKGLTHREQRILTLRFGLEGERIRTLEEIGTEFNVNRERIRQIEAKAIRKLRLPEHADLLKLFLPENAVVRKICLKCQRFIDYYYLDDHPDTKLCEDCTLQEQLMNTKE